MSKWHLISVSWKKYKRVFGCKDKKGKVFQKKRPERKKVENLRTGENVGEKDEGQHQMTEDSAL